MSKLYKSSEAHARATKSIARVYLEKHELDNALTLYAESLIYYREKKDSFQLANTLSDMGLVYVTKDMPTEAIKLFTEAISILYFIDDKLIIGDAYNNLGIVYKKTGEFDKALLNYRLALKHKELMGNKVSIGNTIDNIANVYMLQGKYVDCVDYQFQALRLREEMNDQKGIATSYYNIGHTYKFLEDLPKALTYYTKSKEVFTRLSYKLGIGLNQQAIGSIYASEKNPELARKYYLDAIEIFTSIDNKSGLGSAYVDMSSIEGENKDYNSQIQYLLKALDIFDQTNQPGSKCNALLGLSNAYLQLHQYEEATRYSNEALGIAHNIGAMDEVQKCYLQLATNAECIGDYKLALSFLQQQYTLRDSLLSTRNMKQIENLLTVYDTEKKEKENAALLLLNEKNSFAQSILAKENNLNAIEIAKEQTLRSLNENVSRSKMDSLVQLQKEKSIQEEIAKQEVELRNAERAILTRQLHTRNLIEVLLVSLCLLSGVVVTYSYQLKKKKLAQRLNEVEEKALRAQLKPHFVIDAIASIQSFVGKNPAKAESYLSKFSHFTQEVLVNSEKKKIALADELSMLEKYIDLHILRLKQPVEYKFLVDQHIDQDSTMVPPAILQPLVENAINHNFMAKDGQGFITIHCLQEGNILKFTIEDSCGGSPVILEVQSSNVYDRKSFGIQLVRERLDLWSVGKGNQGYLELIPKVDGMCVFLGIPL
ncbi:MAG: tetratricopeptide repeat protein [Saprospiraceae bacterium]|nr:tetratricopeptide repeat protein [Candidatus Opimibacter skivensis]